MKNKTFITTVVAASVMLSMRERTPLGSRSISPSALPPMAVISSIATPPAAR